MPVIRVLKAGFGDESVREWDETVPCTFSDARDSFAAHFTPGRMAFRMISPGVQEAITEFDPALAGDVLIIPAIQGG